MLQLLALRKEKRRTVVHRCTSRTGLNFIPSTDRDFFQCQTSLASHLAFRGGTALHKLFLNPAKRYSEDIDLVQLKSEPIGPILTALHQTLDVWLGEPRRKQSEG